MYCQRIGQARVLHCDTDHSALVACKHGLASSHAAPAMLILHVGFWGQVSGPAHSALERCKRTFSRKNTGRFSGQHSLQHRLCKRCTQSHKHRKQRTDSGGRFSGMDRIQQHEEAPCGSNSAGQCSCGQETNKALVILAITSFCSINNIGNAHRAC